MQIPYDSEIACTLAKDILAWINYISKSSSADLSVQRGPCGAFESSGYANGGSYLEEKYGDINTNTVTREMWHSLAEKIKKEGIRNITTIALPPTGRSSLTIDASTGIEPFFTLVDQNGSINKYLEAELTDAGISDIQTLNSIRTSGKIGHMEHIPHEIRASFKTTLEILSQSHLIMQAELQKVVDDAISKTINLPREAAPEDVAEIYKKAYKMGLKGITIFRVGSEVRQPKRVAQ